MQDQHHGAAVRPVRGEQVQHLGRMYRSVHVHLGQYSAASVQCLYTAHMAVDTKCQIYLVYVCLFENHKKVL